MEKVERQTTDERIEPRDWRPAAARRRNTLLSSGTSVFRILAGAKAVRWRPGSPRNGSLMLGATISSRSKSASGHSVALSSKCQAFSSKSARRREQPSPKSSGDEESSGTSSDEDAVVVLSPPPSLTEASATAIREGNVKRKRTALPEDSDSELDSSGHVIARKKAKDGTASISPRSPSVSKTTKGRRVVLRDSDDDEDDDVVSLPDPFAATEDFHDPAPRQEVGGRRQPKRLVVLDDSDDDDRDNDMGDGTERADDHAVTVIDDDSVAESGANPDVVSSATGVVPLDDSDDDEVIVAGKDSGAAGENRTASSIKRAVIVSSDDED
ncbi:hypothetical protein ISCGN_005327 [Ixodes scapularis]